MVPGQVVCAPHNALRLQRQLQPQLRARLPPSIGLTQSSCPLCARTLFRAPLSQDKFVQKEHLAKHSIPMPEFMSCPTLDAAHEAGRKFGYPLMLKNRKLAYDGRGNAVAKTEDEVPAAWEKLGGKEVCGG